MTDRALADWLARLNFAVPSWSWLFQAGEAYASQGDLTFSFPGSVLAGHDLALALTRLVLDLTGWICFGQFLAITGLCSSVGLSGPGPIPPLAMVLAMPGLA